MTVYVDELIDYGDFAREVGLRTTRWGHLTADTREEMHAFAACIRLRRACFQDHGNYRWHYDVTPGKRAAALRHGAQSIDRAGLAALIAKRYAAHT
ncbi:DUF4031 domain-containing protein [Streptacidiphilus sp. PB12-B1b]|uniref:DUF4031 domain-containing protein n=1 Tax=Streptacidiphilus sp. PB12-B1b TaxID=2705012 RepID=UPI0015F9542D|nr:DUF4031 domain-containing protein [Streptacidiphilus sp. PB12-B1b]QMU79816.1 DUF4031 domain-containing protein [Streptacidiphilus sp. PB12-B1b]